jgi:hypothetical protein
MATYAENLRYARKPAHADDGSVHLDPSAVDAMVRALFGLRDSFRTAERVDQIGGELDPIASARLYNDLRSSIGLPPKEPPPPVEQRWKPDYGWAIEAIEEMLLMLGVTREQLKEEWPPGRFEYLENYTKTAPKA